MAKAPKLGTAPLLEEFVIKINARQIKAANKAARELNEELENSAAGAELVNEQLLHMASILETTLDSSQELLNNLSHVKLGSATEKHIDDLLGAIQDVTREVGELGLRMEKMQNATVKSTDEVVVALQDQLDVMRKVNLEQKKLPKAPLAPAPSERQAPRAPTPRPTQNATRFFSDIARIAGPLPMLYATIAANVYALQSAFDQLKVGDQLNKLKETSTSMSLEMGVNIQLIAQDIQEATGYAISFENAMGKAAQAATYGFDSDQIHDFTLAARRASIALGVDMDDALNRIIKGVSKLEPELLDELGITVKLNKAYQDYADTLGVTVSSLTDYQKSQAYANAAIAESEKRMGYLNDELKATEWEQLGLDIDSLTKSTLMWLETALTPAAKVIHEILALAPGMKNIISVESLNKAILKAAELGKVSSGASLFAGVEEDVAALRDRMVELPSDIEEVEQLINSLQREMQDLFLGKTKGGVTADQILNVNLLKNQLSKLREEQKRGQLAVVEATKKQKDWLDSVILAESKTEDYTLAMNSLVSSFHNFKSIMSTVPQIMTLFNLAILSPETIVDKPIQGITLVINEYKNLQSQVLMIDSSTKEGQAALKENLEKQLLLLAQFASQGIESLGDLEAYRNQLLERKAFINPDDLALTLLGLEKLGTGLQFASGKTKELLQNTTILAQKRTELANAMKPVKVERVDPATGKTELVDSNRRVLTTQEIIQLNTEITLLELEQKSLTQQHNLELAAQQVSLATILELQAGINNQDPLLLSLKKVNAELLIQASYMKQNAGLMKPEQLTAELEKYNNLLKQQRDIKKQIAEREIAILSAATDKEALERAYNNAVNDSTGILDTQTYELDQQAIILKEQLKLLKEYGLTLDEILSIEAQQLANKTLLIAAEDELIRKQLEYKNKQTETMTYDTGAGELEVLNAQLLNAMSSLEQAKSMGDKLSLVLVQELEDKVKELKMLLDLLEYSQFREGAMVTMGALSQLGSVPIVAPPTEVDAAGKPTTDLMKLAELLTATEAINQSMSLLTSYSPELNDMIANVTNLGLAFYQMGEGALTGAQVAAAGMATISSMIGATSSLAISEIDQQIKAEQERDGQSEESKQKLLELEAEKTLIKQELAQKQIIINTALGITQALATLPPPYSFVMAGATAAMGMLALSAAQSADAIPLVDEGSSTSLTLGEKQNNVDVAGAASAGELAYIQGQQGSGSISDYKPRAVGNTAPARHSILVGENGPEVITPMSDVNIGSNHATQGGSGSSTGSNVNINISAMDSSSFEDFLNRNGKVLVNAVEGTMNQGGNSLYK